MRAGLVDDSDADIAKEILEYQAGRPEGEEPRKFEQMPVLIRKWADIEREGLGVPKCKEEILFKKERRKLTKKQKKAKEEAERKDREGKKPLKEHLANFMASSFAQALSKGKNKSSEKGAPSGKSSYQGKQGDAKDWSQIKRGTCGGYHSAKLWGKRCPNHWISKEVLEKKKATKSEVRHVDGQET